VCVDLYYFSRNYFSKVARSVPAKPARKQDLTRNSHSGLFNVMHFGITEKLTTDCVSLYNNAGIISKVSEEIARENAENCRCRQRHCLLTPRPQAISGNISINLIPPETRVIFAADSVGLSSFHFFVVGSPKDASFLQQSAYRPFSVIQRR